MVGCTTFSAVEVPSVAAIKHVSLMPVLCWVKGGRTGPVCRYRLLGAMLFAGGCLAFRFLLLAGMLVRRTGWIVAGHAGGVAVRRRGVSKRLNGCGVLT